DLTLYRRTRYWISKPTPFVSAGRRPRFALAGVSGSSDDYIYLARSGRPRTTQLYPQRVSKSFWIVAGHLMVRRKQRATRVRKAEGIPPGWKNFASSLRVGETHTRGVNDFFGGFGIISRVNQVRTHTKKTRRSYFASSALRSRKNN